MPDNNDDSNHLTNHPDLSWLDGDVPVSKRFEDPYYSKSDGLSETRHVFIKGNDLTARWQNLPSQNLFTIGELGFGTGLNFLATAIEWQRIAPTGCQLEFISFEKYPLAPADMGKALSHWPELRPEGAKLSALYGETLQTDDKIVAIAWSPQIRLTIHIGDAAASLSKLKIQADAWFLDGFAPSKNPDLWSADLLQQVCNCTVNDGTFATYTAAGWARRNLIVAGFDVMRVKGHAGKREMMIGKRPRQ